MKYFIITILIVLTVLVGCANKPKNTGYKQMSANEAIEMMNKEKDYLILDVRTPAEYASGHIPNAICIPNETITKEQPSQLPNKEQLIFVYCRSGNRSKQAAQKLVAMGFTNIIEIGGINNWTGDITTN